MEDRGGEGKIYMARKMLGGRPLPPEWCGEASPGSESMRNVQKAPAPPQRRWCPIFYYQKVLLSMQFVPKVGHSKVHDLVPAQPPSAPAHLSMGPTPKDCHEFRY